jgi:hypothetical protein
MVCSPIVAATLPWQSYVNTMHDSMHLPHYGVQCHTTTPQLATPPHLLPHCGTAPLLPLISHMTWLVS